MNNSSLLMYSDGKNLIFVKFSNLSEQALCTSINQKSWIKTSKFNLLANGYKLVEMNWK